MIYLSLAAMMVLGAASCKKDNPAKFGVDGKTPLPKAIDLGIVVNGNTVKWASFNLGASREWESGDYYAWGETEPKSDYTWDTYKYIDFYLTRYNLKDGRTTLLPEDDPVQEKLGGKWRMPTSEELDALAALKDNPDYTWFNYYADHHTFGVRITHTSSGATLFLPYAGFYIGTTLKDENAMGYYWSATLDTHDVNNAFYLYPAAPPCKSFVRAMGLPIRPVFVE